jgi:predicted RNA-binding protein with EMAP domain
MGEEPLILNKIDGTVVSVLNLIATYIIYTFIFFIWGSEKTNRKNNTRNINEQNNITDKKAEFTEDRYNQLVRLFQQSSQENLLEKEHYKKIIEDYSKQLELSKNEKDYYKEIATNFHECFENNENNKQKLKQISSNYADTIRKYVSSLVDEIKRLGIEAKTEKITPSQFQQSKQNYEEKIKRLNERIAEAELSLKITHENFTVNLRSIEDKCKAINFVIGRVYSDKHGGNKKTRALLNINRILYNTFSKITSDFDTSQIVHLMLVLKLLQKKLSLYHISENKLFNLRSNPKIPLRRNSDGRDIILDVLSWNDDDPIKEYHAEASEICLNMINYLEENYEIKD